eukprot:3601518-Rhodomonas_salina.3
MLASLHGTNEREGGTRQPPQGEDTTNDATQAETKRQAGKVSTSCRSWRGRRWWRSDGGTAGRIESESDISSVHRLKEIVHEAEIGNDKSVTDAQSSVCEAQRSAHHTFRHVQSTLCWYACWKTMCVGMRVAMFVPMCVGACRMCFHILTLRCN